MLATGVESDAVRSRVPALILALLCIDVGLVTLHALNVTLLAWFDRPRSFFDLDAESNLPTWWSGVQLALVAALVGIFATVVVRREDRTTWPVAAAPLIALFLSLDETVGLHDRIRDWLHGSPGSDALPRTGPWMLVLAPLLVAAVVALVAVSRRHWSAPSPVRRRLALGSAMFMIAAAGVEVFANHLEPGSGAARVQVAVEEGGELLGVTFVGWGAWGLLASRGVRLDLGWRSESRQAA
jgi:hypothetical protein